MRKQYIICITKTLKIKSQQWWLTFMATAYCHYLLTQKAPRLPVNTKKNNERFNFSYKNNKKGNQA